MRFAVLFACFVSAVASASGSSSPKPPPPPTVDFASLPASAAARPPSPDPAKPHPVLARLLADRDSVSPGGTFRLGVLLEQQKDWHTYWKSPGDVGQATLIDWRLPEGAGATPFAYPIPQRFELEGLVSYGYDEGSMFFTTVTLPTDLPDGTAEFGAHVSWLVCEINCIPGEIDLTLPLTVGSDSGPGPFSPLFDHFAAQHPTAPTAISEFAAEIAPHASALKPDKPFRVAILLTPTGEGKLGPPPAQGTWPLFVPIVSPDLYVTSTVVKPTADGGLVAVVEGDALAVDPMPERTTVGGLFQVEVNGEIRKTEVVVDLPWKASDQAVAPSTSPIWKLVETVAGSAPAATTGDRPPAEPSETRAQTAFEATAAFGGLPTILLAAFVGGLILNIMPCVLPVLSLKLYGLVEHSHATPTERRAAGLAYTGGVIATFWVLAAIILVLRVVFGIEVGQGFQMQYPEYVGALAAVVFAFALSLFGVFEIPVVGANQMTEASSRGGMAGHFLTGAFAVLLGTPCSAPWLGTALAFAFAAPAPLMFLTFAVIALGLASPFLAVAFVPSLFRFMPRPGPWMETFKMLMAFTLIATTIWLVDVLSAQVGPDNTTGFLAFLGVVAFGCWIFGHWGGIAATVRRQLTAATLGTAVVVTGGVLFLDFSMPIESHAATGPIDPAALKFDEEVPWQPFSDEAVASLVGHPVFIDFTADWCLTCKVNENTVIDTPSVRTAMATAGVVPLKADWTRRDPVITAWLQRHGRAGVPFYLVLPADPTRDPIALPEVVTTDLVIDAIERAAATTEATAKTDD